MNGPHRRTIVAIVASAAFVLVVTASTQIFDATFYAMSNAVSLLAGDRIYRDFFEPGGPLASYTAAAAQWLSGYRLIGEFVRQWLLILGGFGIAAHLGLRASHSAYATLAVITTTACVWELHLCPRSCSLVSRFRSRGNE
jgi:hypothetical protein